MDGATFDMLTRCSAAYAAMLLLVRDLGFPYAKQPLSTYPPLRLWLMFATSSQFTNSYKEGALVTLAFFWLNNWFDQSDSSER